MQKVNGPDHDLAVSIALGSLLGTRVSEFMSTASGYHHMMRICQSRHFTAATEARITRFSLIKVESGTASANFAKSYSRAIPAAYLTAITLSKILAIWALHGSMHLTA